MRRLTFTLTLALAILACSFGTPAVDLPATETAVATAVMTQLAPAQIPASPTPFLAPNATPPPVAGSAQPPGGPPPFPTLDSTTTASLNLSLTGQYLMSFHACEKSECQTGVFSHKTYLAQSDDGEYWSLVPGWQAYVGSVPDVIRRGNTLYIFNPGRMARYNIDAGVFEGPMAIEIKGLSEGFVDPSLIVDDQRRLVLFFLYGRPGGDPASCPPDQATCEQRFGSATEVEGSDGSMFTLDEGDRAVIPISPGGPIRSASDPDIFFDGAQYVLYISQGPSISVWTSPDLRGAYTSAASQPNALLADHYGVPSGYFDPASQRYWSFAHRASQDRAALIYRAAHADFSRQLSESDWVVVASGESLGLSSTVNVESPGFAVNTP
ncbi:MAG: hypothetical protein AAB658_08850 [Chloroflexota bacterium]